MNQVTNVSGHPHGHSHGHPHGHRPDGRARDAMRPLDFICDYTRYAEGSVLSQLGNTWVLCNVSIEERIPHFLKGTSSAWLTAEYRMLPRATARRNRRSEPANSRATEIQRLIGRSMRAIVNLEALPAGHTVVLDCDVLQADGGTRTTAINGAYIALCQAIAKLLKQKVITKNPLHGSITAVSVGIYNGQAVLDLDYQEDSHAEVDMNVVMNGAGQFIELQSTAEGHAFRRDELNTLLDLATQGAQIVSAKQQAILEHLGV